MRQGTSTLLAYLPLALFSQQQFFSGEDSIRFDM